MRLTMRFVLCLLGVLAYLMAWQLTARADMFIAKINYVFFVKNIQDQNNNYNKPYWPPLDYTIKCFGQKLSNEQLASGTGYLEEGAYTPSEVYRYDGHCANYGCSIFTSLYSLKFAKIDYCNLDGTTYDGQEFTLEKYAKEPFPSAKEKEYKESNNPNKEDYWNYLHNCSDATLSSMCDSTVFILPDSIKYDKKTESEYLQKTSRTNIVDSKTDLVKNDEGAIDSNTDQNKQIAMPNIDLPSFPETKTESNWWIDLVCWLPNLFGLKCGQ